MALLGGTIPRSSSLWPRTDVCSQPRRRSARLTAGTRAGLEGFLDQSGAETTGADADMLGSAVDQCADALQVRIEDPFSLVIGMTDVMSGLVSFATDLTCKSHGNTPYSERDDLATVACVGIVA